MSEVSAWSTPTPQPSTATPSSAGLPRVLVVDDNADLRAYVHRILRDAHDVVDAEDGEAALAILQQRPIDLVVSDVMMPRLGGTGLLAAIRGDRRFDGVPVLLLSAQSEATSKASA